MLEFGVEQKWPPRNCQLKWHQLHPESVETPPSRSAGPTRKNSRFTDECEGEDEYMLRGDQWRENVSAEYERFRHPENKELRRAKQENEGEEKWTSNQDQRQDDQARSQELRSAYEQQQPWSVHPQL
jgi:hypothetical protein